jgi:VanZ family protein
LILGILNYFKRHTKLTLLLAIFWTIGIFIGCSLPGKELPSISLFDHFDKVVHFTFFTFFFILWYLAFFSKNKISFYLLALCAFYGFSIEFYQLHFVAGRSFDVWDGVADTIGGVFGWLLIRKIKD